MSFVEAVDKELGYPLSREIISTDTSDFRSLLIRLKKRNIKRVFLVALVVPSLKFISQAKEMGMEISLLGVDVHANEEFKNGTQVLGVTPELVSIELREDFVMRLKNVVNQRSYLGEAAFGYAVSQMVHQLSAKCSDLKSKELPQLVTESVELSNLPLVQASMSGTRIVLPWKTRSMAEY
jgi:hypothetical protein